jgi:uncharacterized membrane protein
MQARKMKWLVFQFQRNRFAIIIGIIAGGIWTRFLEDSNLLVNSVLTVFTTATALLLNYISKKITNKN